MSINKIGGPGGVAPGGPQRSGGTGNTGGPSFASLLKGGAEKAPAGVSGAAPMAPLDAMLSIQSVDADGQKKNRRRARERGQGLLDKLDDVRLGLLEGRIPAERLHGLAQQLRQERMMVEDPALAEIMAEIELRCEVELAKLGL